MPQQTTKRRKKISFQAPGFIGTKTQITPNNSCLFLGVLTVACFNLNNTMPTCYSNLTSLFSNYGVEEHSINQSPAFVDPATENYQLTQNSPLIDHGIVIQGINEQHINGLSPDIGAFEYGLFLGVTNQPDFSHIKIYPNPTTGFLYIDAENTTVSSYFIYNLTGKLIKSSKNLNNKTIDLNNLPSGVYFLQLLVNNSKTLTAKIIKL